MGTGIRIIRELVSLFGITLCGKCGTRTKIKHTKHVEDGTYIDPEIWEGYTICPKCGNKERWRDGVQGV